MVFQRVPMLVWFTMAWSDQDHYLMSFAVPFSSLIDGVMFLAFRLRIVSQAPQLLRLSNKQATFDSYRYCIKSFSLTSACPGLYVNIINSIKHCKWLKQLHWVVLLHCVQTSREMSPTSNRFNICKHPTLISSLSFFESTVDRFLWWANALFV